MQSSQEINTARPPRSLSPNSDATSEDDHIREKRPRSKKLSRPQQAKVHFTRFWKWYLLGIIILLAILLPILFTVVIPAIVQLILNKADLPIYYAEIIPKSPNEVLLSLNTSFNSPLPATLGKNTLYLYNPATKPFTPYLPIPLASTKVNGKTQIAVTNALVNLLNRTELVKWFRGYLGSEEKDLNVRSNHTDIYVGKLHYTPNFDKVIKVPGLRNLKGVSMTDLKTNLQAVDGKNHWSLVFLYSVIPTVLGLNVCRFLVLYVLWRVNPRLIIPCAVGRTAFAVLDPLQAQALIPSTRVVYNWFVYRISRKYGKTIYGNHIRNDVQPLGTSSDSALMWLGDRHTATKVVYYIHGGGFFLPMTSAHFRLCWEMFVKSYADAGVDVACAALQYTLAPEQKYPGHLRDAVAGLEEIRRQGFSTRDIVIGGDSAGANIVTQLLLHALQPHPEVPPVVLDAPLPAAFLISPYLTRFAESMDSFHKNSNFDIVPTGRIEGLMPIVIHEHEKEAYMCGQESLMTPLDTPRLSLDGLEKVVRKLNITIGDYEAIADHGRAFADIVKRKAPLVDLEFVVGAKEPHDAVLFEYMVFAPGIAANRLKAFVDVVILDDKKR